MTTANFSGKLYEIHSYGVSRETELIDYDAMEKQAKEVRPKMIIGGFSAMSPSISSTVTKPAWIVAMISSRITTSCSRIRWRWIRFAT